MFLGFEVNYLYVVFLIKLFVDEGVVYVSDVKLEEVDLIVVYLLFL